MGPVTTNPWLIALINMTIVFGVLIALGVLMVILHAVDPTKKKPAAPAAAPAPKAAPAAAPAAPAVDQNEIIAVIAAACAATGCSAEQVACVRVSGSANWTVNARVDAISTRQGMF